MTKTIELIVSLKVPDNTSITALATFHKLGYLKIKSLRRADYYKFQIEGDASKFKERISKVDILVNANKHSFDFAIKQDGAKKVLVKNSDDDGSGLLDLLKNRLGFKDLKKTSKATLWSLEIEDKDPEKLADKAAKELLVNEHYQEYTII